MNPFKELNLKKLKNMDLFSPYIVVVTIGLYVALAMVGYHYHLRNLQWASATTFLYVIFGSIFFILGALLPKIIIEIRPKIKSALKQADIRNINQDIKDLSRTDIAGGIKSSWSKLSILLDERILLSLVLLAILLQGLNLYILGGIPLLSGYIKFKATTDLWRVSYLIFLPALNLLLAKYPRKWYYLLFILGLGLFAINGYRTTTIAIILSVLITSYYTLRLKTKYVLIFIALIAIIGIVLGYVAVKSIQWQSWTLNPLELVFYRAGFTMMVLDKIVHMPGFTGGELFYQGLTGGHPRVTVGQVVLGYLPSNNPTTSITSTIFGPAILDFGSLGLAVQMLLLGLILRLMHSAHNMVNGAYTALYAIILAHTMIWIETGPTDSMVWIFYVLAVVSLLIIAQHIFGTGNNHSNKLD